MAEDLKILESLSYRPESHFTCQCGDVCKATLGMNSAVIKPAIRVNKGEAYPYEPAKRVNKAEDACPLKAPLKPSQQPICGDKCTDQPSLKIIGEIEGLISQVNDKLYSLMPNDLTVYNEDVGKKRIICADAAEEIDIFQKTTLYELRKAFE